jgi:nitroreductase
VEFDEVVRRRRMVRRYVPEKRVPPEIVEAITANALRGPSAGFSQGYGFLVLDDADDIRRFRTASTPEVDSEQWYAATFSAPLVIVPCSNKSAYLERYAEADKGFADRSDAWWPAPYWDIDTAFASLLMLLTAVDRRLGACFFGIPKERIEHVRAAFSIPETFMPIGAITVGYADEPPLDRSSRRKAPEELVHRGRWSD